MNIYEKIQLVKEEFLKKGIKKSGLNKFAGYNYYELSDITPAIIELCNKHKLFTRISFDKELATLEIVNAEKPEEREIYTSPMEELELKGANKIQALGGVETYQRRYLYMSALDIIENDMFDAVVSEEIPKELASKKQIEDVTKLAGHKLNDILAFEKTTLETLTKTKANDIIKKLKGE